MVCDIALWDADNISLRASQIVDLTANRLRRLDARLLGLRNVTRLCLRQNLLSDASEIENIQSSTGEKERS